MKATFELFDDPAAAVHWNWWTLRGGNKGVLQPPCDTKQCQRETGQYHVDQGTVDLIRLGLQ